ncbi:MAG: PEP-CTERM sorting domain-containing protein [Candidatus Didemnitutus sp.]|nr:PEP-CTERM sorting domain-containing protein [Candidatus Didemnitutus sp.]
MNKIPSLRALAALAGAALLLPAIVSAQETVAEFQFNAATSLPLNSYASTVTSPLGSVSLVGYPAGDGGYSGSFGGGYFRRNINNLIPESLATALATNHFVGFTFTPAQAVDLGTLTFDFGASNATSIAGGIVYTGSWAAYTSVGGFDSGDELGTGSSSQVAQGANVFTPSWTVGSVDLASLGTVSAPVEVRIYFWDDNATASSNMQVRMDDITLTASAAAIPEPSTYALLGGVLALGAVALRRRRAQA